MIPMTRHWRWLAAIGFGSCLVVLQVARPALGEEPASAGDSDRGAKVISPDKTATFSIVAVDPELGICGAAVASKYPAVGKVVPYVRAGVGAFCTQHYHVPEWGPKVLDQLEQKATPEQIFAQLLAADDAPEMRQLALIDMQGRTATHNPTSAPESSRYWGSVAGRNYSCQGNTLTGPEVLTAMSRGFEQTAGSLADRLMASLRAGDQAGGDHRGRLAAGIVVAKVNEPGHWLELYVDQSDDAVTELVTAYLKLSHPARGEWPGNR